MKRAAALDHSQAGFGFAPTMGAPRRESKLVQVRFASLFYMVNAGEGWFPLCAGAEGRERALGLARERYPFSVVKEV